MSNKSIVVAILAVFALTGVGWSLLERAKDDTTVPYTPTTPMSVGEEATDEETSSPQEISPEESAGLEVYTNDQYGLEFKYLGGADGYTLVPSPEFGPLSFSIFDTDDWEDFVQSTEPREGPPGITVDVFLNVDRETAAEWIMRGERSNYDRARGYENVKIAGYDAVRYGASGLYEMDYAVISTDRYMYVLSASYFAPEDQIRKDFNALLASLKISE